MLPYLATIVVLVLISRDATAAEARMRPPHSAARSTPPPELAWRPRHECCVAVRRVGGPQRRHAAAGSDGGRPRIRRREPFRRRRPPPGPCPGRPSAPRRGAAPLRVHRVQEGPLRAGGGEDGTGARRRARTRRASSATSPRFFRVLGRVEEGLAAVRRACAASPSDPVCHFNESMLRYERMETTECIKAARRAIALKPDMAEAHMRLGQTLLLTGALEEGWEEYEWRYRIAGAAAADPRRFPAAARDAAAMGRRAAGGGATPAADRRPGFRRRADVRPLFALGLRAGGGGADRGQPGDAAAPVAPVSRPAPSRPAGTTIPEHAAFCPLSGLPRLHGTRLESIPAPIPYVQPEPSRLPGGAPGWRRMFPPGAAASASPGRAVRPTTTTAPGP